MFFRDPPDAGAYSSRMPRFAVLMISLLACAEAARAQQIWNFTDAAPRRPAADAAGGRNADEKDTTIFPLSPNTIVGSVQWVDTEGGLAVITVDRGVVYADTPLVAREDDCTPRAVLRPIRLEKPSRVIACRVIRGSARAGLEVVIPAGSLLKSSAATLKAHDDPVKETGGKKPVSG